MKLSLLILASTIPLSAQDFTEIHVEKVSGGYQFLEGPVWSKDGGYLLFSDAGGRPGTFADGAGTSSCTCR